MKKMFLTTMMLMLTLTPKVYANSCMKEYQDRIDHIRTYYSGVSRGDLIYTDVVGATGGFFASGGVLSILDILAAIGTGSAPGIIPVGAIASGVGLGIPIALTAGYVADTIADAPFVKMMKIIERSNIEAGIISDEMLRTDFRTKIPVDGVTRKEIKQQRRYNRNVQDHNRILEKLNKNMTLRINKRKKAFDDLISELERVKGRNVSRDEVAKLVVDADAQEKLCNSEIRLFGKDLSLRTDYIRVTGETVLERMKQRNHNRKVESHNEKISRMIEKKDLAKLDHFVKYLATHLP